MRKLSFCSFFLIMLIFICVPSYAEEGYVEILRNDNLILSVNVGTVEYRNEKGYVIACSKWISRGKSLINDKKVYGENFSHFLILGAFNPKYKHTHIISIVVYDKSRKILNSPTLFELTQWDEVIPNSTGEKLYDYVMAVYKNRRKK
ncbi:MAG: hypothetical protein GXZ18_07845 [Synergistaceae bacterium]|nr:hypothetical protein [Synergistaceae bacterium]